MVATLPSEMRYLALATDYDDTIATRGHLGNDVKRALERLRTSGRRAVLITGRTLEELQSVCPDLDLFAAVVLENGGVLHVPSRRETRVLCPPVPDDLVRALARRGVEPLDQGPRDSRHTPAARGRRARIHPRPRPRAAHHLQRRRGDGAGVGREQRQRPAGCAARAGSVHPRGRRRRQRPERSFVPRPVRVRGGGGQRHRRRQAEGRLHHAGRVRRRRHPVDRRAGRHRPRGSRHGRGGGRRRAGASPRRHTRDVPPLRPEHPGLRPVGRRQVDVRDRSHRASHRSRLPDLHRRPGGRLRHAGHDRHDGQPPASSARGRGARAPERFARRRRRQPAGDRAAATARTSSPSCSRACRPCARAPADPTGS